MEARDFSRARIHDYNSVDSFLDRVSRIPEQDPSDEAKPLLKKVTVETKSRRLYLLIKPSLHEELKAIADKEQMSLNEVVSQVMENFVKKYQESKQG